MRKDVKVLSKIAPGEVVTISANYKLLCEEEFDLNKYAKGYQFKSSFWHGDKITIEELYCPRCRNTFEHPEIIDLSAEWNYDYFKCPKCGLDMSFDWKNEKIICKTYELILPDGYILA